MAVGNATTRDQLEKVLDILRRTLRYLWLAAAIATVGGALSIAFAMTRPHEYESETVLLYREMISQSMLQDREVHVASAVLSSRYKEMLLSRTNLAKVVEELKLYPEVVASDGVAAGADILRGNVGFKDKGSGTFRIIFKGKSPEEAQTVTARLAELLKEEDSRIRREQAQVTKTFLTQEKDRADADLMERERAQVGFLAQHPEFAQDDKGGGGAAIRSAAAKKGGGDNTLSALERQAERVRSRLKNPDKPIVAPTTGTRSPQRMAAEAKVKQAEREVDTQKADLADKLRRFTEKHPDVTAARARLAEAERGQRQAAADLAAVSDDVPAVLVAPFDKVALEAELAKVEREISGYKSRTAGQASANKSNLAEQLVSIEGEWAAVDRAVEEARLRVQALEAKAFTADIAASSEFAESAQLTVIDAAFLPSGPAGKPRKLIALAGLVLFAGLGVALALGLALVDDRIYRRRDLEDLAIAPVLVVVPVEKKRRRNRG